MKGGQKKMGWKEWMQRKIEKNAVVSELDGERVILKKSTLPILGGDWKQIHPPIDEQGNWSYVNFLFGGQRNLAMLIILILIAAMILFQFYEIFSYIDAIQNHPCYPAFKECVKNSAR